jgi:hypothetical protein
MIGLIGFDWQARGCYLIRQLIVAFDDALLKYVIFLDVVNSKASKVWWAKVSLNSKWFSYVENRGPCLAWLRLYTGIHVYVYSNLHVVYKWKF